MGNEKSATTQDVPQKLLTYNQDSQMSKPIDAIVPEFIDIPIDEITKRVCIYNDYAVNGLTLEKVARTRDMSLSTVYRACKWVEANWQYLVCEDDKVTALSRIIARISELDILIARVKAGEVLTAWGAVVMNPKTNEPVIKFKEQAIAKYIEVRMAYEEQFLVMQGILKKTNMFFAKEMHFGDKVDKTITNRVAIFEKMTKEDKSTYLNLLGKYERTPARTNGHSANKS